MTHASSTTRNPQNNDGSTTNQRKAPCRRLTSVGMRSHTLWSKSISHRLVVQRLAPKMSFRVVTLVVMHQHSIRHPSDKEFKLVAHYMVSGCLHKIISCTMALILCNCYIRRPITSVTPHCVGLNRMLETDLH
jgi:hypothetical protein